MSTYHAINPFPLNDKQLLFFDVFLKNNQLVFIMPVYSPWHPEHDKISIAINQIQLDHDQLPQDHTTLQVKLKESIKKIEYEPIVIMLFDIISSQHPDQSIHFNQINITISYQDKQNTYDLVEPDQETTNKTYKLTHTTLFKDDYSQIPLFYDYYTKQGVEYFYLYYNGVLTQEIQDLCNKTNITLIEWNFIYWNYEEDYIHDAYKHHAQIGQVHHALYKYGKQNTEYMIFCDLDEFMYIPKKTICQEIQNTNSEYDTYGFCNYWASSIDKNIPTIFPSNVMIGNKTHKYGTRSKCIHKIQFTKILSIHYHHTFTISEPKLKTDYMLLHMYNWSNYGRIEDTPHTLTIELP
jgi:hypothetical protein